MSICVYTSCGGVPIEPNKSQLKLSDVVQRIRTCDEISIVDVEKLVTVLPFAQRPMAGLGYRDLQNSRSLFTCLFQRWQTCGYIAAWK